MKSKIRQNSGRKLCVLTLALAATALQAASSYPYANRFLWERGVAPIPAEGNGYLMGPASILFSVTGAAFLYGGERPDLISRGGGFEIIYRYVGDTPDGTPMFEKTKQVPSGWRGGEGLFHGEPFILQDKDGKVHALSLTSKSNLITDSVFDPGTSEFVKRAEVKLPRNMPAFARRLRFAAQLNDDGSVDIYFVCKVDTPRNPHPGDPRLPDWKPYDSSGTSTEAAYFPYHYIMQVRYPKLLSGEPSVPAMVSPREKDIWIGVSRMSCGVYLPGELPSLFVGTQQGDFRSYLPNSKTGRYDETLASDARGNALRHPNIGGCALLYPDKQGRIAGLISDGQGLVYYYPSLGKRDAKGSPLFGEPKPVAEKNVSLYFSPLATPTVIDWDGDGVLDILTGGAEGIVFFIKNAGTNAMPKFLSGVPIEAGGKPIKIEAGYSGSVQGTGEARWGYISPTAVDWNNDGLPDLIVGDIRGEYHVYMNRGTPTQLRLEAGMPLYCNGLELKGRWRCGAATAILNGKRVLAIVDAYDKFHLYNRIDDYNLEDAGTLKMDDGKEIFTSIGEAGATGRCKLNFADWDGDGATDIVIGAGRTNAIPDRITGYPTPMLVGLERKLKPYTTILFMKNVGTDAKPVFAHPIPFAHEKSPALQGGGAHETGVAVTPLGSADGKTLNLIICDEGGRGYLLPRKDIFLMKDPPHLKADKDRPIVIERYML